ncbi:MAG: hypothetical protein HKN25_15395 [Pyrinomonadaceae bacterium]|nr:hypothetical protein [Pyrinomonadaceae bacterium]
MDESIQQLMISIPASYLKLKRFLLSAKRLIGADIVDDPKGTGDSMRLDMWHEKGEGKTAIDQV